MAKCNCLLSWYACNIEKDDENIDKVIVIPRCNVINYIETSILENATINFPMNPENNDEIYIKDISIPLNTSSTFNINVNQNIEAFPGSFRAKPYRGLCGITKSGVRSWKYLSDKDTWFIVQWL